MASLSGTWKCEGMIVFAQPLTKLEKTLVILKYLIKVKYSVKVIDGIPLEPGIVLAIDGIS